MFDKKEFTHAFLMEMRKQFPEEGYYVKEMTVRRMNRAKVGVSICRKEDTTKGVIFYAEDYYSDYTRGEELHSIVKQIQETYFQKEVPSVYHEIQKNIASYSFFEKKIRPVLVNYERNKSVIREMPHERIADLAIIPCAIFEEQEETLLVKIREPLLESWGKTGQEIMEQARKNQKSYSKPECFSMVEALGMQKDLSSLKEEPFILRDALNYGAAVIWNKEYMTELHEKYGDFIMVPASINEWFIMQGLDLKDLGTFVKGLNGDGERDPENFLSNRLYTYDGKKIHVFERGKEIYPKQEECSIKKTTPKL